MTTRVIPVEVFVTKGPQGDSGIILTWISLTQPTYDALPQPEKDDFSIMYNIVPPVELIFSVKTDNAGTSNDDQFTVPAIGGPYSIKWSDGSEDTGLSGSFTKTFAGGAGTYIGEMTSDDGTPFQPIKFSNSGDKLKLILVSQWGISITWSDGILAFRGCSNLVIPATDGLIFAPGANMDSMFRSVTFSTLDMTDWDLSGVVGMGQLFLGAFSITSLTGLSNLIISPTLSTLANTFNGMSSLTSLSFSSSWDTSGVVNFIGTFRNIGVIDIVGIEDLDYSAATLLTIFLDGTTLPTTRYSDFLINLEANPHQPNVTLNGGGSKYSAGAAATARAALVSDGWSISDGGQE